MTVLALASTTPAPGLAAVPAEQGAFSANLEVADIPTASTLYGRMFHLSSRIFPDAGSGAGILLRGVASFNNTLMLGVAFKADNVIGSGTPSVESRPVDAIVKIRVLGQSGSRLQGAAGYDGMGYGPSRPSGALRRGRGLYGVVTGDLGFSGLVFRGHAGGGAMALRNFAVKDDLNVFGGVTGGLTESLVLGVELDDVLHDERQVNAALGYDWDVGLRLELDFMNLFHGVAKHYRVLKILYTF